jgi:hypothetical protein
LSSGIWNWYSLSSPSLAGLSNGREIALVIGVLPGPFHADLEAEGRELLLTGIQAEEGDGM